MNTPADTPSTVFTRDIVGRFVCNGLDEALRSTDSQRFSDARPFDVIIVGGGSFGSVLASHLFHNDKTRSHRILVLEAGPLALPEHVQNLPQSLDPGRGSQIWDGDVWNSDSPQSWNREFPGLAFCMGGRSLFWGGWSPYFIESEMDQTFWPKSVRLDLMTPVLSINGKALSYLDLAARQIGTDQTNDFIHGPLHVGLRRLLFDGVKARPPGASTKLTGNRGNLATQEDLEAPLAVQSSSPRAGFFPLNKFNGVQLLIRAVRAAQAEAEAGALPVGNTAQNRADAVAVQKRLMACANTKVVRLERDGPRIARVITIQNNEEIPIDVPPGGKVFLAQGTIESTRLALLTLPNAHGQIGRNLMAHLRSNLTIRVPRDRFRNFLTKLKQTNPALFPPELSEALAANELGTSALFVKGIRQIRPGLTGHFHVQITASGVGGLGIQSEAELFKKWPGIEELDRLAHADDQWIVITLRGIGEMFGERVASAALRDQNRITLDTAGRRGYFDYGQPRALVSLEAGPNTPGQESEHTLLWNAMDDAALELANVFADGGEVQYLHPPQGDAKKSFWSTSPPATDAVRDKLSSTHHEGGTLRMGNMPQLSATDEWGRLWESENLYAIGPALLPTLGSPNPMLSGVALAFRIGDRVLAAPPRNATEPRAPFEPESGVTFAPDAEFRTLFDGTGATFGKWFPVGANPFALADGCIVPQDGADLGLLVYGAERFDDFILRLEFKLRRPTGPGNDNSGVFIRFRDPRRPLVLRNGDPAKPVQYDNGSYVAVDTGFEVQIDEEARGNPQLGEPDGMNKKRTGAIYDIPTENTGGIFQDYRRGPVVVAGFWNTLEIRATGQTYQVFLNGRRTTTYANTDAYRGKPKSEALDTGFLGLQAHTGRVSFRNVRVKT